MVENKIFKHVLKNAYDFGSVNSKVVLGLVLRENPELKKNVPKVLEEIEQVVKDVEKLNPDEIKAKLEEIAPELLEEKKEEKRGPLKPLRNAQKEKVVTRIAPSPSGTLHIGHAYGASLNYEYAKMYEGKLILRIEDTNPENIYEKAYQLIEEDTKWLCENNVAEVIIQSERLGIYYDYAEKLVQMGKAYVCQCNPDEWREMKAMREACSCRKLDVKEQQLRYAKMFNEYSEGEAVLKLKTDIKDKNPAMRDFSIMRINEHIHPRTGKEQRVWPLMVFSVAVDDHELGVTHVLNGKDHADNSKKESIIMEYLGWKKDIPNYQHWGRINFKGMPLSSSKTKIAIEQNEFAGWDDIRLPFLPALRRRGYQPEAFRKFALEIGLSLNDKTVSQEEFWKMVDAFNREIVEPEANRYFFVEDPVGIVIKGAPQKNVEIDLHPDNPKRGKRKLKATEEVHISENDYKKVKEGKTHRLMDYCNFKLEKGKFKFVSENYEDYKKADNKGLIIHWLPVKSSGKEELEVNIMQKDGTIVQGVGEDSLKSLKERTIVQLERMYFAKLDKKEKGKIVFWYLHK